MKNELHITARVPQQIQSCEETFFPNNGYGTIELTPYGDYLLNTTYITETAARRTNEYKSAYKEVTENMFHAYEEETRAYTSLHENMPLVESAVKLKKDLMTLAPQKYERGRFTFSKPTKDDIEKDLIEEAKNINFDMTNTNGHVDEKMFVKEHVNEMIEIRQHAWQEACDFFNKIEDAREERVNAKFYVEYKTLYNRAKEYIEGNETSVKQELLNLCGKVSVPYNLSLSFAYNQTTHILETSVIVEDGISVPISKAVILASRKISIKNKLVRETITEKTISAVSLTYFLAAHLFNVSPNVQYLRLFLYERNKQSPLLWVEFEREKFLCVNPYRVSVVSDILSYPNVLEFKNRADSIALCAMDKDSFDNNVAMAIQHANEIHPKYQSSHVDLNNDIAISFDDVSLPLKVHNNIVNEVHKAISLTNNDNNIDEDRDPLFRQAAELLVIHQQGSTSLIQRKFSIKYIRAARLMDQLEHVGIIGPTRGAKPREVLVSDMVQLENIFSKLK